MTASALSHFRMMAGFNAWANARLGGSIEGLSESAYRQDQGAFFGSIHRTLNHLLVVDRLWTSRIAGEDRGIASLEQLLYEDRDALREAREEEDRRFIALVDGLSAERLSSKVSYRRMIGDGWEESRVDHILATLLNHQTHHRGQIHCLLTQQGLSPPALDVIFFLEEQGLSGVPTGATGLQTQGGAGIER